MIEQHRVSSPAVATPAERVEAAIPMVEMIAEMAREDCSNAVEAGRQLERIADQAGHVLHLLHHGREAVEVVLDFVPTGGGASTDG